VLDRLSAEHVVVHEALVELDAALVEMLTAGLLDHLDDEEAELLPALGRLGVPV
jgi:hypothetical protein